MHITHLVNFVPNSHWAVVRADSSMLMVGPAKVASTIWSSQPHTTVSCSCDVSTQPTSILHISQDGRVRVVAQLWSSGSTWCDSARLHCRIVGECSA